MSLSDLIQCPKCGLRQSARHAYCARCEYRFTGSPDESVLGDEGTPTGSDPTPHAPAVDVFAGLDVDPGAVTVSEEGPITGEPGRWRREGQPPRSESIRASRAGGRLVADRGSLSRRLSRGSTDDPTEEMPTEELPEGPTWEMPTRTPLPGTREPEPRSTRRRSHPGEHWPAPPTDVSNSGSIPGYLIRGRPQSGLYASEHSVPPQDPMMADLVAGRVTNEHDIQDDISPSEDEQPPVHSTFGDVPSPAGPTAQLPPGVQWERADSGEIPAVWTDEGMPSVEGQPRVVPPSRGQRRYSHARRRDPRGRAVATHPDAVRESEPPEDPGAGWNPRDLGPTAGAGAVTAEPAFGGSDSIAVERPLPPTLPPPPRRGTAPGSAVPSRRHSGDHPVSDQPLQTRRLSGGYPSAPPASTSARDPRVPPVVWRLGILAAVLLSLVAAINMMSLFRGRSALTRTLDIGIGPNGPTPDLPSVLRQRLAELDMEGDVEAFHSQIAGLSNSYRVGVHMETHVAGYPVGWVAIREGSFEVDKRIRALQVYVSAGWELDTDAMERLTAYTRDRKRAREPVPPPAAADDDDSAETPPDEATPDEAGSAPSTPDEAGSAPSTP